MNSDILCVLLFFLFVLGMLFANQWGEYRVKLNGFWLFLNWHLHKRVIQWLWIVGLRRWKLKPWLTQCEVNPSCFWTISLFQHCIVFYDVYDRNDFPLVNVRFSMDVEQKSWFPCISGKCHDVKYWILGGTCSKSEGGWGIPSHEEAAEPRVFWAALGVIGVRIAPWGPSASMEASWNW